MMNRNAVIRSGYPFGWGAYESTLVRGEGIYVFDQNGIEYKKYGYHTSSGLTGENPWNGRKWIFKRKKKKSVET